jgi:hypothetical protein
MRSKLLGNNAGKRGSPQRHKGHKGRGKRGRETGEEDGGGRRGRKTGEEDGLTTEAQRTQRKYKREIGIHKY